MIDVQWSMATETLETKKKKKERENRIQKFEEIDQNEILTQL